MAQSHRSRMVTIPTKCSQWAAQDKTRKWARGWITWRPSTHEMDIGWGMNIIQRWSFHQSHLPSPAWVVGQDLTPRNQGLCFPTTQTHYSSDQRQDTSLAMEAKTSKLHMAASPRTSKRTSRKQWISKEEHWRRISHWFTKSSHWKKLKEKETKWSRK